MSRLGALHMTKHTGAKHSATVIFFHGSGSTGPHMLEWVGLMVKNFTFPHIKVLYPTAPLQPYTPAGGGMSNVWFDRGSVSWDAPDKLESIASIEVEVKNLIKTENEAGIPSSRIIVGGFSMGGALSLHTAYRWEKNVAGTFVLSSFLYNKSVVYDELKNSGGIKLPPLLQIHGNQDEVVDLKWAETTFENLKALGVQGQFYIQDRLGHHINKRGIILLQKWIEELLPDFGEQRCIIFVCQETNKDRSGDVSCALQAGDVTQRIREEKLRTSWEDKPTVMESYQIRSRRLRIKMHLYRVTV